MITSKKGEMAMATSLINTECKRYGCMKNLLACYANCKYNSRCEELRQEVLPVVTQAASDINSYRQERGLSAIEIQTTKRGLKFMDVLSLKMNSAQGKKRINGAARIIKAKPKRESNPDKEIRKTLTSVEKTARKLEPGTGVFRIEKSAPKAKAKKATTRVKKMSENKILPFTVAPKAIGLKAIERLQEMPKAKGKKKRRVVKRKSKLRMETQAKMPRRAKAVESVNRNDSRETTSSAADTNQQGAGNAAEKSTSNARRRVSKQDLAKKKKKMFIVLDGNNSALVDEKGLLAKVLAGVSPGARYFEATEIELRLQIAYKK
jgi:hypothetical protein